MSMHSLSRNVPCSIESYPAQERVLDALCRPAMAVDLAPMVVRDLGDRFHLLERHRERVLVVAAGCCGVAGRIGLQPLGAVLDETAGGTARLVGTVDDDDHALHPDLAELGVPIHQASGATDLLTAWDEARADDDVRIDRFGEPHVGVEQAACRAGRRVAALQRHPGIESALQRHHLRRVLDVEILEDQNVEVRGVEVGLDEARHDRPALGVDLVDIVCERRRSNRRARVADPAAVDDDDRITNGRRSGAVDQVTIEDTSDSSCDPHA